MQGAVSVAACLLLAWGCAFTWFGGHAGLRPALPGAEPPYWGQPGRGAPLRPGLGDLARQGLHVRHGALGWTAIGAVAAAMQLWGVDRWRPRDAAPAAHAACLFRATISLRRFLTPRLWSQGLAYLFIYYFQGHGSNRRTSEGASHV